MATTVQLTHPNGRNWARLLSVLVALCWFSGCVSVPDQAPDDQRLSTWQRQEARTGQLPDSTPASRDDLVDSLQRSARERAAVGQWSQAEALVLRALRIEPQAADLYLQLAELKTQQGDTTGATAIARKGLTYAESDSAIAADLHRFAQSD